MGVSGSRIIRALFWVLPCDSVAVRPAQMGIQAVSLTQLLLKLALNAAHRPLANVIYIASGFAETSEQARVAGNTAFNRRKPWTRPAQRDPSAEGW